MRLLSRTVLSALLSLTAVAIIAWAQPPAAAPAGGKAAAKAPVAGSRTGGLGGAKGKARPASAPAPRWPDGHPMLSAAPGKTGFWNSGTGGLHGKTGGMNLPTNLELNEIPFQPWAKALYEERRRDQQKNDPHARCMPPGGPRQFHTPYGLLIYELPEMQRVLVLSGGGPRTWRVIYTDGRPHPSEDDGDFVHGFLGHSVGKWEGDTLVIDTVGFNEQFWFARAGYPHTESLHLIERITRVDYDTLKYEVTVDDPKAYTKPWTGGHLIYWVPDEDFEEYFCQGNNRDAEHMVGQ